MWFLALKHIFFRKAQTILTFLGIVIGGAAYVIFSGMQLGFQEYMVNRLINSDGHIKITPREEFITDKSLKGVFFKDSEIVWFKKPSGRRVYDRLSNARQWYNWLDETPEVIAYAPQITKEVIFTNGAFSIPGSMIGIDPVKQVQVTNVEETITAGNLNLLNKGSNLVIVGEDLLKNLGARLNDNINVVNSNGVIFSVKIVGTLQSGNRGIDSRTAYSSINSVQLIGQASGQITRILVKLNNLDFSSVIANKLALKTRDRVESWDQANVNFLSVIETQNTVRTTITFVLIMIIAFSIYNILNMTVNHKKRDIAILRSMGFDQIQTTLLFLLQGILLGLFGALLGIAIGALGCAYAQTIPTPRGNMSISWDIDIYIQGFLLIFVSSLLASFIPARNAGKLSPIEIIRGTL